MQTFTEAVEDFLKTAHWLTDADKPAIVSLQQVAAELDANGVKAALVQQYGLAHRHLMKRAGQDIEEDEDERFLENL